MITIIHGDDIASSRNYLNDIKSKFPEGIQISPESLNMTDLSQRIDGGGFFETEKVIIIEQLYVKRKAKKEFEAIVEYLKSKTLENEIYIWENKELDKKSLSLFNHPTIKTYKLPQTLFFFLDAIKPGAGKELVRMYHETLKTTDAEMVFFMLIRHIRLLLALQTPSSETIDEAKRLAPWQQGKVARQAKLFSESQLLQIHEQLFTLDKEQKTGELSMPLNLAIDILLLQI
ncbi:MAG: hypothetical protein KBC15_01230 [Candidatus Levybacteria bacterium]|nr:hypothetical protein [Candidatus Levybacteria bacterium]